jgi:hypothetical protein
MMGRGRKPRRVEKGERAAGARVLRVGHVKQKKGLNIFMAGLNVGHGLGLVASGATLLHQARASSPAGIRRPTYTCPPQLQHGIQKRRENPRKIAAEVHNYMLYPLWSVLTTGHRRIEEGQYYEAHQQLRVVSQRYIKAGDYNSAIEILSSGAQALLKAGQSSSGGDLCLLLVDVYRTAKLAPDAISKGGCCAMMLYRRVANSGQHGWLNLSP